MRERVYERGKKRKKKSDEYETQEGRYVKRS